MRLNGLYVNDNNFFFLDKLEISYSFDISSTLILRSPVRNEGWLGSKLVPTKIKFEVSAV